MNYIIDNQVVMHITSNSMWKHIEINYNFIQKRVSKTFTSSISLNDQLGN